MNNSIALVAWATRVTAAVALVLSTVILGAMPAAADTDISPAELTRAKPGTVFRIWPLEGGVRNGYKGYRVLYRSTGLHEEPIAVTGAVIFPAGPGSGKPRKVVAWAHPTSGVVTRCAPTLMPDLAGNIQGLDFMTDKGYVVVAADYAGLGSPGLHPYLVGKSEAHVILDSIRAAQNLKDAHAGDRFVVWGHSQGGHAALFTGLEAASYAPELKLLGVATAAPATKLLDLFEADRDTPNGKGITAMALYSWSRVYGFPLSQFVNSGSETSFTRLASDCILSISDYLKETSDLRKLEAEYLKSDPTKDSTIRAIMEENTPGPLPNGTPVFIAQSLRDTLVRPEITRAYAKQLCDGGAKLKLVMLNGGSHIVTARNSAYKAVQWMEGLFAGAPPPNEC